VRVEVDIVVVAISGSGVEVLTIGVVSGVNRMAHRRESSLGSGTLSGSDSVPSGGTLITLIALTSLI